MRIILYLCTRYHAVLAHWGGEGVGAIFYWNSVLQRVFLVSLNLGNSNVHSRDIAERMLRVV